MRKGLAWALVIIVLLGMMTYAVAEEEDETVWVLCNPESYVNIREHPWKGSAKAGFACCGDDFRTDGKTKNGFLHVYAPVESGEGWISTGYICTVAPEEVGETWHIDSNGRVAVRSSIGGTRTRWMKDGAEVYVYYIAEYAITNRGFIDATYLSP